MVKKSIWDWLAYFALASIVVWLILKGLGIINTPFLIEYYPYFVVTYFLGWQTNKLSNLSNDFKKFSTETIKQVGEIKLGCAGKHG